jgi:serine/threonine protein kinase
MQYPDLIGETLDDKYHLERELGRGGMGTVFLATHLGTERPVALKIISPEYMKRDEFVERFRREARAAGRLRHPNVVNVTDFGFASSRGGEVAYLVMEYLDGCTLGEILHEERNLPVSWTLEILDQVCSAVQEAHEQGIIHRDLKPDNIWLEPNQRGGYTVKVLDFGIAKLEEPETVRPAYLMARPGDHDTIARPAKVTLTGVSADRTLAADGVLTLISEPGAFSKNEVERVMEASGQGSLGEYVNGESKTSILGDHESASGRPNRSDDGITSKRESQAVSGQEQISGAGPRPKTSANSELTRIGAVLGTPLYMSPEQCRGEHLDPRSDIYSLGVIAYQMLSGRTPFSGDFKEVMELHKTAVPPPMYTKRVRRKMQEAILMALEKSPDKRPETAGGFASVLRSRSEGIFGLLRRALVIYSEHLPKFLLLSAFFEAPVILLTILQVALSFLKVSGMIPEMAGSVATGIVVFLVTFASAFCATLLVGTIVWIVTQYLAVPLRPVRLRPALEQVRNRWKTLAGSGIVVALSPFAAGFVFALIGLVTFGLIALAVSVVTGIGTATYVIAGVGSGIAWLLGFFWAYVRCMLVAPVIMMESPGLKMAFRRSSILAKRSFATSLAAALLMFLMPMLLASLVSILITLTAAAVDPSPERAKMFSVAATEANRGDGESVSEKPGTVNISIGTGRQAERPGEGNDMRSRLKHALLESLAQLLWLPLQIFVLSFSAIIVALIYLKARLAGGEPMNDLIKRFENDDGPRRKWQERVQQRLLRSGRIPSTS